jgi:hypothetical protein
VQTKVSRSPIVGEFANASSLYLAVTPRLHYLTFSPPNPAHPFDDLFSVHSGSLVLLLHWRISDSIAPFVGHS